MPTFTVEWTATAEGDLNRVVDFAESNAPGSALAKIAIIERRAASLETMPNRGRWVPELAQLGIHLYRELVVAPYRIIYRVDDRAGHVYVVAVFDSRSDLVATLQERFLQL